MSVHKDANLQTTVSIGVFNVLKLNCHLVATSRTSVLVMLTLTGRPLGPGAPERPGSPSSPRAPIGPATPPWPGWPGLPSIPVAPL